MNPTAMEHLEAFRKYIEVERGLASWPTYRYQIQSYLHFLSARGLDLPTVTRDDVVAYLEEKKKAGLKNSSLYVASFSIRQFHRFLVTSGRAAAGPTDLKLPKFRQLLPEPLYPEEMERLLNVPTGHKFHRVRMAAALQITWATGLRVSEVTNLQLEDVNRAAGWIRVRKAKNGNEKIVPIGANTVAALSVYIEARSHRFPGYLGHLFLTVRGRRWTRGAFWWQLKELAKKAGLSGRVYPHRARHGFATVLLSGGASLRMVQEALSHVNVTTTQRYTHILPERLKKVCEAIHPRF